MAAQERTDSLIWWLLLPVLLLTMALGARYLDADPIWIDELYSVGNIGAVYRVPFTPAQVWESVRENSPQHTPGYFMILSGWASLVGWSPFALRALSLWFGLLTVVWTYRAGREWLSPRAGLYAAIVMSAGAFFIHFTHEIRMYTLIAFLTAYLLWLYLRLIRPERQPRRWEWAGFFVGALALIYTHTIGSIPLAAIGLYHLLFVPKNRRWLGVVGILALAGMLFLPWLPVLLEGSEFAAGESPPLAPLSILREMLVLFSSGNPLELIALVACAVAAVIAHRRHAGQVWFFVIVMFLLTLLVNEVTSMLSLNRTRYLIHLWPLLALLAGLGLTMIQRWRWLVTLLLLVWVGAGIRSTFNPEFLIVMDGPSQITEFPPLREIVEEVNALAEPADFLVTFAQNHLVYERYKFVSIGEFYFHELEVNSYRVTLPDSRSPSEIRQGLLDAVGRRLTVWFAYEPEISPRMLALYRSILEERYQWCDTALDEPDLHIERYDYAAFGCLDEPAIAPVLSYREGITLSDLRVTTDADGVLRVAAGWDVAGVVPPNTYSASFKVWPVGRSRSGFVAQSDYGLRSAGYGWQLADIAIGDLPPGEYVLTATVYDWQRGTRLLAHMGDGWIGDEMWVAPVSIPVRAR